MGEGACVCVCVCVWGGGLEGMGGDGGGGQERLGGGGWDVGECWWVAGQGSEREGCVCGGVRLRRYVVTGRADLKVRN